MVVSELSLCAMCMRVLSEMVVHITVQPAEDPLYVIVPYPWPAPVNPDLDLPDWKMDDQGYVFMYCWGCELWILQPQGTAPIDMTCQDCAAVSAVLGAWSAEDAAAELELELEAGDSQ